jgi:UDPglucose 6-dehydrogenase
VLGLSYKPDTQVIEESQGVSLAAKLSDEGYLVTVFDPLAMQPAETMLTDHVMFASDLDHALADADVAVVTTAWPEFKEGVARALTQGGRKCVVIDPWRMFDQAALPASASLVRMGYGARSGATEQAARRSRASA